MEANDILDDSVKVEARYRVELIAKKEAAEEASQARTLREQELHHLESRRTKCNIARIIIVCICALSCGVLFANFTPDITEPIFFILGTVVAIFWCSFLPFGFCPIIDFINEHAFWIKIILVIIFVCLFVFGLVWIGSILLVLWLLVPVLMFALCVGSIYFFYLKFKIKKTKRNVELAYQNEQAAYAEYQAF